MSQFSSRNEPVAITIEDSELFFKLSVFIYSFHHVHEFPEMEVTAIIIVKFIDQIVLAKQLVELFIFDGAIFVLIEVIEIVYEFMILCINVEAIVKLWLNLG